jgi:hypothetical protein
MAWDRYLEIIINLSERGANTALASQSGLTALRQADFVQNDAFPLRLIFVQETGNPSAPVEVVRLEPGSTIVFSGKLASALGGSTLLYYSDAFEEQGNDEDGWYYIADLDTNTEEVAAAFTALSSTKTTIATVNEVEIQNADNTQRTSFQHACLLRRQVYNGEGAPNPAGPEFPAPSSIATATALADEATDREAADATLTTAAAAAHAAHIAGKALSFDGTGYATFSPALPATVAGAATQSFFATRSAGYSPVVGADGDTNIAITPTGGVTLYQAGIGTVTILPSGSIAASGMTHVALVWDGANGVTPYVNRVPGTAVMITGYSLPNWRYFGSDNGSTTKASNQMARFYPWNLALSADEVLALYNRGGLPLPSELGASMTSLLSNGGFETGSGAAFTGWSTDTYGGGSVAQSTSDVHTGSRALRLTAAAGANGAWAYYGTSSAGPLTAGKRYRLTFWAKSLAGNAVQIGDNITSTAYATIALTGAWAKYTLEFVAQRSVLNFNAGFPSANLDVLIDDAELIPLGVLAAPMDGDQCAGYQLQDRSGNGHHLNLPATGVEIVNPARRGQVTFRKFTPGWERGGFIPTAAKVSRVELSCTSVSFTLTAALGDESGDFDHLHLTGWDTGFDRMRSVQAGSTDFLAWVFSSGELWMYLDDMDGGDSVEVTVYFDL